MSQAGLTATAVVILLLVAGVATTGSPRVLASPPDSEPSRGELDAITARGQQIAVLDSFAASATDAMMSHGARWPEGGLYICLQESTGLRCEIGTLGESEETFSRSYLVVEDREDNDLNVFHFQEPEQKRGWLVRAASAVLKAGSVFPFDPNADSYNHVVVPEDDGTISVYFFPATQRKNVRVIGADGVVRVRSDGTAEVQRFHQALLVFELPADESEYTGGAHTHTEVSAPNPLDVFYAIMAPGGSEYILGPSWSFEVDHSGSIRSMGETERFVESLRKSIDAEED